MRQVQRTFAVRCTWHQKGEHTMDNKEKFTELLNVYRGEIIAKSPKSYSIWQANRTVMPAGVGSLFRLADPFPMVVKWANGARCGMRMIMNTWILCLASRP